MYSTCKMNVISLHLLDRDVEIGCLYDYNNAKILPGTLGITSKDIEQIDHRTSFRGPFFTSMYDPLPAEITITTDISEKGRLSCIGINNHLSRQLVDQKFDMNRLWFYSYLKDEAFVNCNNNEVIITAYLKFDRRGKRLSDKFISSNIWRYDNNDHGGSHLVINVDYGAEFVLWIRRPIDPFKESKQFLEQTLHVNLESYLEILFKSNTNMPPVTPPKDFDKMTCSLRSSIPNGSLSNGKFEKCIQMIKKFTYPQHLKGNDRRRVWRPVGIEIRQIPTKAEIRASFDLRDDEIFELKQNIQLITQRCNQLSALLFSPRTLFLKEPLLDFQKLLEPMASEIEKEVKKLQHHYFSTTQNYRNADSYKSLLSRALQWLKIYNEDVNFIHSALEGNSLPVYDLRSMKEKIKDEDLSVKRTKILVLHFRCDTELLKRFKKWAESFNRDNLVFKWEFSWYDEEREYISGEIKYFVDKALKDKDVDFAIGILTPNSPLYKEGEVITMRNEKILRTVQ